MIKCEYVRDGLVLCHVGLAIKCLIASRLIIYIYLTLRHSHPGMKSVLQNLFPEHSLVKDAPAAEQQLFDENQDGNQVSPSSWSKLKSIMKSY